MKLSILILSFYAMSASAWTLVGSGLAGWETRELTFSVNYDNCPVSNAVLEDAVDAAIEIWNGVPTSNLVLRRGTSTTDVATFVADAATDTPVLLCDPNLGTTLAENVNNIPGVALRIRANPNIEYGGILLNAQAGAASEISNLSDLDLRVTVAHELGHVLGLGHSSLEEALMYFSISNKTELIVAEDDMDGLSFLYPSNFGCAAVYGRTGDPTRPLSFFSVLLLMLLGTRYFGRQFYRR